MDTLQTELATRCLWSLQEVSIEIEGLMLTSVDGLALTTTMQGDEGSQRLAAVATTMFLLGEDMTQAWGSGESTELFIKLMNDAGETRYVYMVPVGFRAVLVAIVRMKWLAPELYRDLRKASQYLDSVLDGEVPPAPQWGFP
ncbi:MAG: roadblock/LC7 domain-containing protein [Anaerolineae bacterium]|nr:roadblock/LC7 domain-containing protein [Anaerolineae bacterium]